jgi:hypothetical protein
LQGDVEDAVLAWLDKDDLNNAEGSLFDAILAVLAEYKLRVIRSDTFILDEVREAPSAFPPIDWEADDSGDGGLQ